MAASHTSVHMSANTSANTSVHTVVEAQPTYLHALRPPQARGPRRPQTRSYPSPVLPGKEKSPQKKEKKTDEEKEKEKEKKREKARAADFEPDLKEAVTSVMGRAYNREEMDSKGPMNTGRRRALSRRRWAG